MCHSITTGFDADLEAFLPRVCGPTLGYDKIALILQLEATRCN